MDRRFSDSAGGLGDFPSAGREGLVPGTRELIPHPSYRLVYEVIGGVIWILALVHTSREWPPAATEPEA